MSEGWITGKELIDRWHIEEFELFDYLKQGLQPYNKFGKRIFDADPLGIQYIPNLEKQKQQIMDWQLEEGAPQISEGASELLAKVTIDCELKDVKKRIEKYPEDALFMSFSVPAKESAAIKRIAHAMDFLFKKEDVLEFEKMLGIGPTEKIKDKKEEKKGLDLLCPDGTGWHEVKITLIASDTVRVDDLPPVFVPLVKLETGAYFL